MEKRTVCEGVRLTAEQVSMIEAQNNDLLLRAQELHREKHALEDRLADAEEQAQALKQELDRVQSTNEWLRRELDMALARYEVVELIFGGNRCGGCN